MIRAIVRSLGLLLVLVPFVAIASVVVAVSGWYVFIVGAATTVVIVAMIFAGVCMMCHRE